MEEIIEFFLIFRRQDGEDAGEAVAEIVHARRGFPSFGFWSCAVLRVFAIGADLGIARHIGNCSFVARIARRRAAEGADLL